MTKKILFVDDDALILDGMSRKFSEQGYEVVTAANGEEGFQAALQQHPDLIVSDVLMPQLTGLQMLEKLRQDDWGKTARVLMLTNDDTTDSLNHALEDGVTYYLPKTISIDDLVIQIGQLLTT